MKMKKDIRATLKLTREVRGDFIKAKPANITTDQYIRLLLLLWEEKKKSAPPYRPPAGPIRIKGDPELVPFASVFYCEDTEEAKKALAMIIGPSPLRGRPKGVKETKPRKRRTKAELTALGVKSPPSNKNLGVSTPI